MKRSKLAQELAEARKQQAATAEILRVIRSSPANLKPVLDAVVKNAARLCDAHDASIFRVEGDLMRRLTVHGRVLKALKVGESRPITRGTVSGRAILDRRTVQVRDLRTKVDSDFPELKAIAKRDRVRTLVGVPLLRDGKALGAITVYRREVRPFTRQQIALLKTFADQAAIAIENVRLFNETKEALERQTATGEILASISGSIADTRPVFNAIVRNLLRLFGTRFAAVGLLRDGKVELAGIKGERGYEKLAERFPVPVDERTIIGRVILAGHVMQFAPMVGNPAAPPASEQFAREFGFNAQIAAPMIREGKVIGAIVTAHRDAVPFNDKQVALLKSFADQAVIAIENVRLFNETKEALERQTATAEILKVICSSPTDVQPVFEAIARNALALCGSSFANVFRYDGKLMHYAASHQVAPEQIELVKRRFPAPPDKGRVAGRAILSKSVVCIEDALADPDYDQPVAVSGGWRRMFAAPMLREGEPLGAIAVGWTEPGRIPEAQEELLKTFADQAVIAIENVRLFNETKEALEQQTAISEILRVISSSPTDVQPVLQAVAERAARICEANDALVVVVEGDKLREAAEWGEYAGERPPGSLVPLRGSTVGRAVMDRRPVQIEDAATASEAEFPFAREMHRKFGHRTIFAVPLLRENQALGAILLRRKEVRPFTDKQIALLKTFADQAAIAIENVRLFNETKEALERQTATAEILKVISSSPTDVQPVFDAIAENGVRLCNAGFSNVFLFDGELITLAATHKVSQQELEGLQRIWPMRPHTESIVGRAVLERRVIHVHDYQAEFPRYASLLPTIRSIVEVPMLRGDIPIGVLSIYRREIAPFTQHHIELLKTFADQAVIAIENVRLFNETKEALEQQTATAEILRVISSSPTNVQPVFDAIASSALHLFGGLYVAVVLARGKRIELASAGGRPDIVAKVREAFPIPLDRESVTGRTIVDRAVQNIPDMAAPELPEFARALSRDAGVRALLGAPMLREGMAIGAIMLFRDFAGEFDAKQVSLLKTFADQAVIAIENVRLFNETRDSLEQQTAISEILRVISASPTDVQPVLEAVAQRAARICDASDARIFLAEGDRARHAAGFGDVPLSIKLGETLPLDRQLSIGRAILDRAPLHIEDMQAAEDMPPSRELAERSGWHTVLVVPLLREAQALGAITLRRMEVRPFTEKQIALLKTFADQAAIAIENVRLFNETKEALERQTATSEVLRVISQSQTDTQPVFDAIIQSAVRLCDGTYGSMVRVDGDTMHLWAHYNYTPEALKLVTTRYPALVSENSLVGFAVRSGDVVHSPDRLSDARSRETPYTKALGIRAQLTVPLLRSGTVIGTLNVLRKEAGPFTEDQIELLKTFADQAVIAIENVRLFNETKESLEQQTAISEILRVISGSPSDVQPVLNTVAERAARICVAQTVDIILAEGGTLRVGAAIGPIARPGASEAVPLDRTSVMGRSVVDMTTIQVADLQNAPESDYPLGRKLAREYGHRTILAVPLLRENRALGTILLRRTEVRPFEDKHIALLKTFADQAAIAIENVRLFNETKEALERQTATAEILKVISGSPTDVQPVFDAIVRSAVQLCSSSFGIVFRFDGKQLHVMAHKYFDPEVLKMINTAYPMAPSPDQASGRAILGGTVAEVPDTEKDSRYRQQIAKGVGFRSTVGIPMLRDGVPLGAIVVAWKEPSAYTAKQIDLLKTFADQAVIAIENVRLFKELEARTAALTQSVGQLTALGEVGQAISSTLDLETVLQTIVSRAVQLTGLDGGSIYEYDERAEEFRLQAAENMAPDIAEDIRKAPTRKGDGALGRTAITLESTQVPDTLDDNYQSVRKGLLIRAGYRALLAVPLLREDHLLGGLLVNRKTPGPFAPEVVELLKTFATQSAMAIQNARLFREIADKGRQLEVASRHKSDFLASMSHELRTPLNAILGFNEMLLGQVYGEVPADMKEPLTDIQTSGRHLLRLINNVLDLAKIEAGRMELALGDYSVQDTVESVRSSLRPLAADKGLEFVASVPGDLPLAFGDAGRITQCLMNLAGNALKFTRQGKVEISVALNDGMLVYRVADTGIGIPKDKIETVFSEFRQTDASIASEYGGTGLGLSISKKFVEMHRGRIWVDSEPGKGSAFSFEIPHRLGQGAAA